MKVIGITGGIGTGKSTILGILEKTYNAYIMETDKLAHRLMCPGESVYESIIEYFGTDILQENQFIDRGKLGQIVFHNQNKLQKLNEIVHPAVKAYILEDIQQKQQEGTISYYVIEAALLIEDGYKSICDEIWYIYTTQSVRIERLINSRGGNEEKWLQIIKNQSTEDYYREHCDVIIDNGEGVEKTAETIKELLCK